MARGRLVAVRRCAAASAALGASLGSLAAIPRADYAASDGYNWGSLRETVANAIAELPAWTRHCGDATHQRVLAESALAEQVRLGATRPFSTEELLQAFEQAATAGDPQEVLQAYWRLLDGAGDRGGAATARRSATVAEGSMTGWTAEHLNGQLVIAANVNEAVSAVLAAMSSADWPPVTTWRAPFEEDDRPLRTDSLFDHLKTTRVRSAKWRHSNVISSLVTFQEEHSIVGLHLLDIERDRCWRWVVAFETLVHELCAAGAPLARARLEHDSTGLHWLPRLPEIGGATYLFAGSPALLAGCWDDVDGAITAGGWERRDEGGRLFLTRALRAETNLEFLEATVDGQWAMARLARPRVCHYDVDDGPVENEMTLFRRGDRRLFSAGYRPDDETALFSCVVDEGQHVQPWEVWTLGQALRRGTLPSGDSVRAVHVIFADRASALRERRPLLDVGVTVQFYGDDGALTTLPPDA
ncbi:MAG: hypothetical protein U0263_22865 [Polyangiaceae bacterium]